MSLINQASLVITPNAYKEGVLYSVIPNTTLGDMDVVRATTATRVNSAGLIENVPYNLVTWSEDFSNASWNKVSTTVVTNAEMAPNGTLTADTMTVSTSDSRVEQTTTLGGGTYTFSIYVKVISQTTAGIMRLQAVVDSINVSVNFTPTTEWQLYTATFNATTSITSPRIRGLVFTGTLAIWGAQLVTGTLAKEYFPTTDRLNVPRLDYTNSTCPSILVEPQRTNLALRSEEFSNVIWEKGTPITLVSNTTETTSPQGTNNATKATANGTGLIHIRQTVFAATTLPTTNSIFVKKANNRYVGFRNGGAGTLHDVFDFDTETWTNNSGSTLSFDKLINGWYRLKSSRTNTLPNTYISIIIPSNTSGNETATVSNLTLYIWGGQSELNVLNATSYIPTIASTVTRNADFISKTGISGLIGQTEGTVYIDFNNQNLNSTLLCLNKNSTNSLFLTTPGGTSISARAYANSVSNAATIGGYTTFNQKIKACFKYGSFGLKLFVNGELKATNTSPIVFTASLSSLNLNDDVVLNGNSTIRNNGVLVFPTALTDAQCELLTGDSFYTYDEMAIALNYNIQ